MNTTASVMGLRPRTALAAVLIVTSALSMYAQNLINVDFGVGVTSLKVGLAATGQSTNDFWNLYSRDAGTGLLTDLKYADGSASPVSILVSNAAGAWGSGASDPMMATYLYPSLRTGSIPVTVTNLPAGLYDLYFYAHGQTDGENGVIHVVAGTSDYGTNSTTTNANWNTTDWQEGRQYVRFQGIRLNAGDPLQIDVQPGSTGLAVMNGFQLLRNSICASVPPGLVAWWAAEGNANDVLGNHSGVLSNGVAFAPGKVGQAFSFDGTNDFVRVDASPGLDVGTGVGMTIEGWIQTVNPNAIQPMVEWNDGVAAIGTHFWLSAEYPPGSIRPLYANLLDTQGVSHVIGTTSGYLKTNEWEHVAVTYDKASGVAVLYLDGAMLLTENLGSFTPQTSFPLWLGIRAAGPGYWLGPYHGLMDEMSVYSRALSAGEIQAIYSAGSGGKCPETCTPAPSGLVGWWPGEGSAEDLRGGLAGTLINGVGFAPASVGRGFLFDGTSQAVVIPCSPALVATNFSIEAWVCPLGAVSDLDGQDLIFGQGSGAQVVVKPGTNGIKVAAAFRRTDLTYVAVAATNEIPTNAFSHVVGTWDGTALRVYLNGALDTEVFPGGDLLSNTNSFFVGGFVNAAGYTGQFLNGIVDEPSLYNRALAPAEVRALFNAGSAGKCGPVEPTTVVADWTFEDGVPGTPMTTALDSSGNGHDGSIIIGSPGYAASPPSGSVSGKVALSLGSNSGFRPTDSPDFNLPDAFTLEVQMMSGSNDDGDSVRILAASFDPTGGGVLFGLGYRGSDHSAVIGSLSSPVPLDGASHHVAGVYARPVLSLFVDGRQVGTTNIDLGFPPAGNAGRVSVGSDYSGGFWFGGLIDRVRISKSALLPADFFGAPFGPVIRSGPTDQSVLLGHDVTFQVDATGATPLSFQWLFGTNILADATNSVLTLTNVQTSAAGDYRVVVTNLLDSATSAPAHLTVQIPPRITVQPNGQTVLIGSSATFSVVAEGDQPLSYQWRRNGFNLSTATGPILVIGNVQQASAGTYTVRVSNAADSVISDPAVLKLASGQLTLHMTPDGPRLDVVGQNGANYAIEYSADAAHWSTLATFLSMPDTWFFTDPSATGVNERFYRLRKTP